MYAKLNPKTEVTCYARQQPKTKSCTYRTAAKNSGYNYVGYYHAKFERPPLNSVHPKANIEVFVKS